MVNQFKSRGQKFGKDRGKSRGVSGFSKWAIFPYWVSMYVKFYTLLSSSIVFQ